MGGRGEGVVWVGLGIAGWVLGSGPRTSRPDSKGPRVALSSLRARAQFEFPPEVYTVVCSWVKLGALCPTDPEQAII